MSGGLGALEACKASEGGANPYWGHDMEGQEPLQRKRPGVRGQRVRSQGEKAVGTDGQRLTVRAFTSTSGPYCPSH